MFAKAANPPPTVPSRNALRVLRQLAFAGSTVGGFCTVGVVTYDVHRRVRIAEQIIENKRTLRTSAPYYDATASAKRLATMMEAAEAGEFMGLESMKKKKKTPLGHNEDKAPLREPDLMDPQNEESSPQQSGIDRPPYLDRYGPFSSPESQKLKQDAEARVALARDAPNTEELFGDGETTFEIRMKQLISEDKEIEAANIFLQDFQSAIDADKPFKAQPIGRHIFAANCLKGNIFLARNVFTMMAKFSTIDSEMWATMMHLLAKEGHIDSVGSIYEKHCKKFALPDHLLEVVLRSLLESRRVDQAKRLFYSRIRDDENGGLCGAFLDGLWRKTRKIDLVVAEFRSVLSSLSTIRRSPTDKVFNPLVKAFIESGQHEDAEALVADMPTKHNVQPGSRTLGLLLYAKALLCDWEGVLAGMHEMQRLGFTREKRSFAYAFDRVFLEYYPTHTGDEILDFLVSSIDQFGLVPDKVLHRHILEAFVERGTSSHIGQITRIAQERQWNTGVDQADFQSILSARRVAMQDSPVGFWRMLQAAKKQYGQVASSRRLLGSGPGSYSLDRAVLYPIHKPAEETVAKTLNELVRSKPIDNSVPLRTQMVSAINAGRFEKALLSFRNAGSAGFVIRPIHMHLAVIATILANGRSGLPDAQIIIKSEYPSWLRGTKVRSNPLFPLVPPIFFQQILQLGDLVNETNLFKMAVFEYYSICRDTPHLTVNHHALASLSKRLIIARYNKMVIDILTAVYKSTWRKTHGFDQVLFKLLMRAFAFKKNLRGVWWCMVAVLARKEPVRRDFLVETERLMNRLETLCARQSNTESKTQRNTKALKSLYAALKSSQQGDKHWVDICPMPQEKNHSRLGVVHRSYPEQDYLPEGAVEDIIRQFDEEIELDLLMNGSPYSEKQVAHLWSEYPLLSQARWLPEDPEYPS